MTESAGHELEEVLRLHFDRDEGAPYWLEVQERIGVHVPDLIRGPADFHRLGPMDPDALRRRPLEDFVPRRLRARRSEMILAETGGATGAPSRRVYLPEEFDAAFVAPWERAASARGFPRGGNWLWVGPSGPHVIAQAARAMARRLGCLEPFAVDCDPRWARRQEPGSLGHRLYVDHVLEQALDVLCVQRIETLFTTPPLLAALAARMTPDARTQVRGIHLGGLRVEAALCRQAREEWFPRAVVLPGYGNSLFGVAFEKSAPGADHAPVYAVDDPHLRLQIAPIDPTDPERVDLARTCAPGERGRVVVHRWDRSFLLLNWVERDAATAVAHDALTDVGPATPRRAAATAEVY